MNNLLKYTIILLISNVGFASIVPADRAVTDLAIIDRTNQQTDLEAARYILEQELPTMLPMYNISSIRQYTIKTIIGKLQNILDSKQTITSEDIKKILDDFESTGMKPSDIAKLKSEILKIFNTSSEDHSIELYESFLDSEESLNSIAIIVESELPKLAPMYQVPIVLSATVTAIKGAFQNILNLEKKITISTVKKVLSQTGLSEKIVETLQFEINKLFSKDNSSLAIESSFVKDGAEITQFPHFNRIFSLQKYNPGYRAIENYQAPALSDESMKYNFPAEIKDLDQVNKAAWIKIETSEEFIKILNSKNPERFFLINAAAKIEEMIKGAEIELAQNSELNAAYGRFLQGDYGSLTNTILRIRDKRTNAPVIGTMALKLALEGDSKLLLWYIDNVPGDNDDMLNGFWNTYTHSLVIVLAERPELIKPVREVLLKEKYNSWNRRYYNYRKFNRDSNSGFVGITPLQLAIMTYNQEVIKLLLDINITAYCVDNYGNLFLREVAACRYDYQSFADLLKNMDYDVLKKNINQEDQIDIAIKNKDVYYAAYLVYILYLMEDSRYISAFERIKTAFSEKAITGIKMLNPPELLLENISQK